MKIEWHEDDFEVDEDLPETKKKSKADTLDKYSEEMARDAVSSLFDEEAEEEFEDDEPVVTGFDKPSSKSAARAALHAVKPDREKLSGPRVQDVINGDEAPPRKRDRTREANPVPKPAVRYAPPPPRERRIVRTAPVASEAADDYEDADGGLEDEVNTFRKRYKSSAEPTRRPEGTQRPRGERQTHARPARLHYDNVEEVEEDEPISPLRWVFIASSFVLLAVLAVLAYRVASLSNELALAKEEAKASPDSATVTTTQLANEQMQGQLDDANAKIAELEAIIAGNETAGGEDTPVFGPDNTQPEGTGVSAPVASNGEGPAGAETTSQTYTVVSGDSLSKIAQRFFGSQRPEFVDKIMTANSMTSTNIAIGDVLTIPPQ